MRDLFELYTSATSANMKRIRDKEDELIGFPKLKYGKQRFYISNHKTITNIYGLIDPRYPNGIRYIGKGDSLKDRLYQHMKSVFHVYENGKYKDTTYRANWIRSVLEEGVEIDIVLIAWIPKKNWKLIETHYISLFWNTGYALTNDAPSGQGGEMSEEAKIKSIKKVKLFHKNNPGYMSGENNGMWEYAWTKEQRENIDSKNRGKKRTDEQKLEKSIKYTGSGNPNYGKRYNWINNGVNVRLVPVNTFIPKGWKRGQGSLINRKGENNPNWKGGKTLNN